MGVLFPKTRYDLQERRGGKLRSVFLGMLCFYWDKICGYLYGIANNKKTVQKFYLSTRGLDKTLSQQPVNMVTKLLIIILICNLLIVILVLLFKGQVHMG